MSTTSYKNLSNLLDADDTLIPDIREVLEFKYVFIVLSFDTHTKQFFVHYVEKADQHALFNDVEDNVFTHYDQAYQRFIRLIKNQKWLTNL